MNASWEPLRFGVRPVALGLLCFVLCVSCASSVRFSSAGGIDYRLLASSSPAQGSARRDASALQPSDLILTGVASYYGDEFQGRKTASGEMYDKAELSAAHRTLPFGTMVRVKNLQTEQSVLVRINDRGPFKDNRVIDLSRAAAERIGLVREGTGQVEIVVMR